MFIINAVKFGISCFCVWSLSVLFFAFIAYWRPDLDVMAGAGAMTIMYTVCALTAVAVSVTDRHNA